MNTFQTVEKKESFYPDGHMKTSIPYLNGKLHGTALLYWPNHQLKRKCEFIDGVRSGVDQMFSEGGRLVDEGFYQSGKPVKVHTRYRKNGMLIEKIEYLDERRFNLQSFNEAGNLVVDAHWEGLIYFERVWDRFQKKWIEKKENFHG